MANNKKPRKKYRPPPKQAWVPLKADLTPEERLALKVLAHDAQAQLVQGSGGEPAWFTVVTRLLFGAQLARRLYTEAVVRELQHGVNTAEQLWNLYRDQMPEHWVVSSEAQATIASCLDAVDEMQDAASLRLMGESIEYAFRRAEQRYGLPPIPANH